MAKIPVALKTIFPDLWSRARSLVHVSFCRDPWALDFFFCVMLPQISALARNLLLALGCEGERGEREEERGGRERKTTNRPRATESKKEEERREGKEGGDLKNEAECEKRGRE